MRAGTELLRALSALSWSQLPAIARDQAIRSIIDNIACGMFGSQFPWGRIATDFAFDEGSRGAATIFGSPGTVSPARAALCNGTMIHGFESDDMILGSLSHAGTVVVPAALAMAEHRGATADQFLLGVVTGYEMLARLGTALGVDHNNRGFHTTGIAGPVAAAVASATIIGLSFDQLARAVGIACSCAAGIKAFTSGGGMTKRLHGGRAAEAGVTACLFAERGFDGPTEAIDGPFGLLQVIGGDRSRAHILFDNFGQDWAIGRVWIKMFPCCAILHPAIQAVEAIRSRESIPLDAIKAIRIGTMQRAVEQNNDRAPAEMMAGQYSMPFCIALTLAGDIRDPASFSAAGLHNAATLAVIPSISLHCDAEIDAAYPEKLGARVEIETADGRRHATTVWDAHGTPTDPCGDDELGQKFRALCAPVLARAATEHLLATIRKLTHGGSLSELSAALQASSGNNNGRSRG